MRNIGFLFESTSSSMPLLEFQARRGFARVDLADLEQLADEESIEYVHLKEDENYHESLVLALVLSILGDMDEAAATELMLDVHHKGRAVVSNGSRERAEFDVYRLHEHGLWATMEHESL